MFTGIVEEIGTVLNLRRSATANVLTIQAKDVLEETSLGDSIAVNGICLTVTGLKDKQFTVDVMPETFRRTNLEKLRPGDSLNLERALAVGKRLGGHFVSGHIDGVGVIASQEHEENAVITTIKCDPQILEYTLPKGSIAVDGISLTVGEVGESSFWVSLIPHTVQQTVLKERQVGDVVNLEADMLGKYVFKAVKSISQKPTQKSELTIDKLKRLGF